jgi:hypothetical protein
MYAFLEKNTNARHIFKKLLQLINFTHFYLIFFVHNFGQTKIEVTLFRAAGYLGQTKGGPHRVVINGVPNGV